MRITRFEELARKAVPWFIIAALVVILLTSCTDWKYYPDERVCIDGKIKGIISFRSSGKETESFTWYPVYKVQYYDSLGRICEVEVRETRLTRCEK